MTISRINLLKSAVAFALSVFCAGAASANDPVQSALEVLKANPDAMSAVRLLRGNGAPFCTIGKEVDKTLFVDNDRTSVLYVPEFRTWHGRGAVTKYTEVRSSAKELVEAMRTSRCQVVVESARNITAIVNALEQDEMRFSILPAPVGRVELAEAYAASLGFASHTELLLAAHMLANSEELRSYFRFGIHTTAAYDEALTRMKSQDYSQDPLQLLAFLSDEAEGLRRNLTPATIREERQARSPAASR